MLYQKLGNKFSPEKDAKSPERDDSIPKCRALLYLHIDRLDSSEDGVRSVTTVSRERV